MQTIQEMTLELWDSLNCARSAACGILLYYGFEQECNTLNKALIPFGGGIGERSICGSVTGALSALSVVFAKKGYKEDKIAEIAKSFKEKFSREFKTLYCREILKEFTFPDGTIDADNPKRKEKCTKTVLHAVTVAKILIDLMNLEM